MPVLYFSFFFAHSVSVSTCVYLMVCVKNSFKDMPFYWSEEDFTELAGHPIVQVNVATTGLLCVVS